MTGPSGLDSRVSLLRQVRGDSWFATMDPSWGLDERTGLQVQADATGWVRDVRVENVPEELRSAAGLEAALRRALGSATLGHLAENARERRLTPDQRHHAQDLLAGRARVVAPRVTRVPRLLGRPTEPMMPRPHHTDERLTRRWVGRSRDGEIVVAMSVLAGLLRVDADPTFLQEVGAEMLRFALREAFDEIRTSDRAEGRP